MPKITNEFKTGLMLIIVLIIVLGFVYSTGALHFKKEGYTIRVFYDYVSGLRTHSPVRLCGAEVGYVKDINIICDEDKTHIAVDLFLDDNAKVRTDSKFYITTLGLMGEKYIEITGGSTGAGFIDPAKPLEGEDPFRLEVLMDKAEEMADNLDQAIKNVNKLTGHVNDIVTRKEIDKTLKNIEATTGNFKDFSADLKAHPWKLLIKSDAPKEEKEKKPASKKGDDDASSGYQTNGGVLR
jgi:phospholipid/cholesterol/gamma-HCH transport system substrate-binding protein